MKTFRHTSIISVLKYKKKIAINVIGNTAKKRLNFYRSPMGHIFL